VKRAGSGVVVASDPGTGRSWIVTARHLVDPPETQEVYVALPGRMEPGRGSIRARSAEFDLAIIELRAVALPAVRLKQAARLGDDVWVVSFPWGRRLTLASAVISQLGSDVDGAMEGAPRMVDASVSYGSSGGGVYDAVSGRLVGIVESYRTARVRIPENPNRTLEVPVAGETTLVSAQAVVQFFTDSGLAAFLAP
jgi:hypothetical protein